MPGTLALGYYPTTKIWLPVQVDSAGRLKVDMSAIKLNDLANVSVASPADDDLFYFDNATGLWKSRKLVDADIPAGIARDAEVVAAIADHADDTTGVHGAGANTIWHGGLTDIIDKTHLSQDFGAGSARLANLIPTPISGDVMRVLHASASPFSALINGAPTATSVVYDGEANEGMFNGLTSYNAATYWGKIILHNTTRGNSRKIEAVNIATNTITTESSTDDWANNDVITVQSVVNTGAGFFDLDLSTKVPATTVALLLRVLLWNQSADAADVRGMELHPFEDKDSGKVADIYTALPDELSTLLAIMPVIDQKITWWWRLLTDHYIKLSVQGYLEYADT